MFSIQTIPFLFFQFNQNSKHRFTCNLSIQSNPIQYVKFIIKKLFFFFVIFFFFPSIAKKKKNNYLFDYDIRSLFLLFHALRPHSPPLSFQTKTTTTIVFIPFHPSFFI